MGNSLTLSIDLLRGQASKGGAGSVSMGETNTPALSAENGADRIKAKKDIRWFPLS